MTTEIRPSAASTIQYPDSDGKPMADNTLQFRWIVTIKEGLEALFADDPNVFVAGDFLWYPVEGRPDIRVVAPDAMVAFGRPKGDRGSYQQWKEGNVPFQVVFEVLSPGNTAAEMTRKGLFYEKYGVEEYYLYDPDREELSGWLRDKDRLVEIPVMNGWRSPRLNIRFVFEDGHLVIYRPDGGRFLTYVELMAQHEEVRRRAEQAEARAEVAQEQAATAQVRADQAEARAARLAEKLRSLGIEPDAE